MADTKVHAHDDDVAHHGKAAGIIAVADALRPTERQTIDEFHRLGIEVTMLTGDYRATAERIASHLGLDTVFAEVLPGNKALKVKEASGSRQARRDGRRRDQRRARARAWPTRNGSRATQPVLRKRSYLHIETSGAMRSQ